MTNSTANRAPRVLSVREVAWLFGIDSSRVWRAIRLGTLPVVRHDGRVGIPARALAHLADDCGPNEIGRHGRGGAR
jgi:hypothetical protein